MLILVLLGMYFDAAVVFVMTFLLLFRLALAILCAINIAKQAKSEQQSSTTLALESFPICRGC